MKRALALGVLASLLAVPAVAAGGWVQPRGDAAATGFQPDEGPDWPNVALHVQLPGNAQPLDDPPPLILEDRVIFIGLPLNEDATAARDGDMRAYTVNLDTGDLSVVARVPGGQPMRMATDGQTLYLSGKDAVHARPLAPDGHNWTWTWSGAANPGSHQVSTAILDRCQRMVLDQAYLTVLCYLHDAHAQGSAAGFSLTQDYTLGFQGALVARLDVATGEEAWVSRPGTPSRNDSATSLRDDAGSPSKEWPLGLAEIDDRVIVATLDDADQCSQVSSSACGTVRISVRALAAADGELLWSEPWRSPRVNRTNVLGDAGPAPAGTHQAFPDVGNPATSEQAVYVLAGDLYKLNIGTGEKIWNRPMGAEDVDKSQGDFETAISLAGRDVYATTAQTVYRVDVDDPQSSWSSSLNFSANEGFQEDPIVTPGTVYTASESEDGDESVHAFDVDTGTLAWSHPVPDQLWAFSVGRGVLAYTLLEVGEDRMNTSLVVLGRTAASPVTHLETSTTYPDVGETVEIDLSGSEAGAQGPVTRYKAIWGDGTETDWRTDPVLNHAYDEPGDVVARFLIANDANQTNSTTMTFRVGQAPPSEPNAIETAFQKENQDMTFGILGVAMALGGGVIGVARRKRKTSILQQELEALEQGYEELEDQPSECEAFLDNRKARARSLAIDGNLGEEQVSIVENRAEELRGQLRLGALEEEFAFLPHGLVTRAREMVQDGDVTSLEREAFLAALEEDEMLTDEQKGIVRERIERWHGRDKGGGVR